MYIFYELLIRAGSNEKGISRMMMALRGIVQYGTYLPTNKIMYCVFFVFTMNFKNSKNTNAIASRS
jgi:hypothetical protein